MSLKKIVPLLYDTHLAVIKNSVGSNLFRNSYAKINGKKTDILKNGLDSCAFFVSSILRIFGLIEKLHATVNGAIKDLKKSGWYEIKKPKNGCVLIWEAKKRKFGMFKHIGFYIGNGKAISNDSNSGKPIIHHWTYGTKNKKSLRKIDAMFWNKKLI